MLYIYLNIKYYKYFYIDTSQLYEKKYVHVKSQYNSIVGSAIAGYGKI